MRSVFARIGRSLVVDRESLEMATAVPNPRAVVFTFQSPFSGSSVLRR